MSEFWYALQVRPRFEKHVQMHLEDKGYEVFYPTFTTTRQWSDRVKSLSFPFIPRICLLSIQCPREASNPHYPWCEPGGGCREDADTVVDEAELLAIRRVMQSGVAAQPWPYLRVGETVQIENGPLEGMTGIVTRIKNSCRLVVSVSLLMRSVSVELDSHWIKPVSSPARAPESAITDQSILAGPRAASLNRSW